MPLLCSLACSLVESAVRWFLVFTQQQSFKGVLVPRVVVPAPLLGASPIWRNHWLLTWQQVHVRYGPQFAQTRYPLSYSSPPLASSRPSLVPPAPTQLPTTKDRRNESSLTNESQHLPKRAGLRCHSSTHASSQQKSAKYRLRQPPRHHHRPSILVTRCTRSRALPHGNSSAHPRSSSARPCHRDRTQACGL